MILDNHLTWNAHIKYIHERCQSALNLMRCISGQNWGADKTSLLRIYRAFIRSKLDYGSMAYNSASDMAKKKLDAIQASALKICCGAIRGTSVAAMQVECGEMPLDIRRIEQSLKYAAKLDTFSEHQTKSILQPSWKPSKAKKNRTTFLEIIQPHMNDQNFQEIQLPTTPPWHQEEPTIDLTTQHQLRDSYHDTDRKTLELWQTRWNADTKARHCHNIQPEVNRRIKFVDRSNRAKESLLTRLRLGRCALKHYLHQMKIGDDGKCTRCQVEETVEHWLMECPGNVHLQQQLTQTFRRKSIDYNTRTVLNDAHCLEEIYIYAKQHNTNI